MSTMLTPSPRHCSSQPFLRLSGNPAVLRPTSRPPTSRPRMSRTATRWPKPAAHRPPGTYNLAPNSLNNCDNGPSSGNWSRRSASSRGTVEESSSNGPAWTNRGTAGGDTWVQIAPPARSGRGLSRAAAASGITAGAFPPPAHPLPALRDERRPDLRNRPLPGFRGWRVPGSGSPDCGSCTSPVARR